MSDIFISYASADRPKAQALAEALGAQGFKVWWDRKIPTGEAFDEELERQLDAARAIVVLWSTRSIKSKWVKDEASEGLAKKALFPVMIEEVRLPFGYRRIQTADFKQWNPGDSHLGFDQLVASLRRAFGGGGATLELDGEHPAPPVRHNWFIDRWRRSVAFRIGLLGLPAVIMGLGAVAMMSIRMPTHVQLDLKVHKVKFMVGGTGRVPVLDTLGFSSLYIERFRSISLSPKSLRVGDAVHTPVLAQLVLVGTDESLHPSVQIRGVNEGESAVGKMDLLLLDPDTVVTLERRGKRRGLLVKVEGQPLAPAAVVNGPIRVQAAHVRAQGLANAAADQTYELETRDSSPEVKIESSANGLTFRLNVVGDATLALLPKGGTLVKEISVLDMTVEDKWESTLIADGTLSYPEHPTIAPVTVAKSDFIGLSEISRFAITQLNLEPDGEGLQLRLDGKAKRISLRAGEFTRDARLSLLNLYRSSANAAFLVTLILGVLSGTWSVFTALREARA